MLKRSEIVAFMDGSLDVAESLQVDKAALKYPLTPFHAYIPIPPPSSIERDGHMWPALYPPRCVYSAALCGWRRLFTETCRPRERVWLCLPQRYRWGVPTTSGRRTWHLSLTPRTRVSVRCPPPSSDDGQRGQTQGRQPRENAGVGGRVPEGCSGTAAGAQDPHVLPPHGVPAGQEQHRPALARQPFAALPRAVLRAGEGITRRVLEQPPRYASRAVQFHHHGGQFDFVWLPARTMHPQVGPQHVW